jgi:hypothetical protein
VGQGRLRIVIGVFFVQLCACGKNNELPEAYSASYSTLEETLATGFLRAFDPERVRVTYSLRKPPDHGRVSVDALSGSFSFEPDIDYYGTDSFTFVASDGEGPSQPATISLRIFNVNDAPRIAPIPNLHNSAESEAVEYFVDVGDPDPHPEPPLLSLAVADPDIVDASITPDGLVSLKARGMGSTTITVMANDGETEALMPFEFVAEAVTKTWNFSFADPENHSIALHNVANKPIDFLLTYNGFPVFESVESVVTYVQEMPQEFPSEGFDRKLWRLLRDSVYHEVPLSAKPWLDDSWVTLNSLGWGFCSNVAAAYVQIAHAAGYEARMWGLYGHVVSEIQVDGEWRMYDTDLAVYYWTEDGRIAGVEELVANPALITNPIAPLFAGSGYQYPYSQLIADLYSSSEDNLHGEPVLGNYERPASRVVLPPGARLVYPGNWTEAPIGYDAETPYEVRQYRQALLELEDGWTGSIALPWMVWEILGSGQVGLEGTAYQIGSAELTERLRETYAPITSIDVYAGAGVQVIFFINAVRFDVKAQNRIDVHGLDVWAIEGNPLLLPPEHFAGAPLSGALLKPLPTVVP